MSTATPIAPSRNSAYDTSTKGYYQAGTGPLLDIGVYPLTVATTILGPVTRVWGQAGIAIPERAVATGPLTGQRFPVEVGDRQKLGELRGDISRGWPLIQVIQGGIPAAERRLQLIVQDVRAYLEQQVRSAWCPAHLLLLDHALADRFRWGVLR